MVMSKTNTILEDFEVVLDSKSRPKQEKNKWKTTHYNKKLIF